MLKTFLTRFSTHTRGLYRNAGILFSGNAISAIFSLFTVALMTRTMTLEDFGRYALITAFISLVDRLVNFQSWQALIHFGSSAKEAGEGWRLISLFTFGWYLDVITGVIGYLVALSLSLLVPRWFGLGADGTQLVAIAGCLILLNWTATPTAIFRLYNKFYIQALYHKISAGALLLCTIVLWLLKEESLMPYVVAFTCSGLVAKGFFYVMALRELKQQQVLDRRSINIAKLVQTTPRLWRFVITTNLDGIVRVFRDIDIFIVNALMGPTSVALYKVARILSKAFGKVTGPVYQAIYPELSKLSAASEFNEFKRLMKESAKLLGTLTFFAWLIFVFFGTDMLEYGFGQDYSQAYGVAILCIASMVVWSVSLPLSPAMMALGKVEVTLLIHVVSTCVYLIILFLFTTSFGLIGSGLALLLFYILWSAGMLISVRHQLNTAAHSLNIG